MTELKEIKHAHLFNVNFMSYGSLHKEEKPQRMVKPEYFSARFDEKWTVVEKWDRAKS